MAIRTREIFRNLRIELINRGYDPPSLFNEVLKGLQDADNYFGQDQKKRMEWAKGIEVKRADSNTEVLFYVGCYGAFDPETIFTARATANLIA
jgi:Fe-S oxidoreductase